MKLKIKEELKGLTITITNMSIGQITFDSNKVDEANYINFYNLGFSEIFEVLEEETPVKKLLIENKIKRKNNGK